LNTSLVPFVGAQVKEMAERPESTQPSALSDSKASPPEPPDQSAPEAAVEDDDSDPDFDDLDGKITSPSQPYS
jgi:hypothetical protein